MDFAERRLNLIEKLKIQLKGHIYIGNEKREGWKEAAPFYMFKCPVHGYVKNAIKGRERLECPECLEDMKANKQIIRSKK